MRQKRFTFLCNQDERNMIKTLAERLQRSQSDAIRLLIGSAIQELTLQVPQGNLEKVSKEVERGTEVGK
jgi:hypothetical protein